MREMDLILGGFVDAEGESLDDTAIGVFDTLLERRDQQLYAWIAGRRDAEPSDASEAERKLVVRIRSRMNA